MIKPVRTSALFLSILSSALAACASAPPDSRDEPSARRRPDPIELTVARSDAAAAIFVGEIIKIEPGVSQPDDSGTVIPVSYVTWRVDRSVRGVAAATWTGRFVGGTLPDGRTLTLSEMPDFELGQHALVLATNGDEGSCPLVECRAGLVAVGDSPGGLDGDQLDAVIARFDGKRPGLVRSADPRQPFVLEVGVGTDRVAP